MHVNDLHATLLHLLGIDHERLTYRHNGRSFRLTDGGAGDPRAGGLTVQASDPAHMPQPRNRI